MMGAYRLLRPLPWKRILLTKGKKACVSVSSNLQFLEVSTKTPERFGFIRIHGMNKDEVYDRLKDKRLDPETVPFHIKVRLEEGRDVEIDYEALSPYLRQV
jgi:hypothetical protein